MQITIEIADEDVQRLLAPILLRFPVPAPPTPTPVFFKPEQVQDILQIGRSTFYELISQSLLTITRVGKQIRISDQALQDFIDKQSS